MIRWSSLRSAALALGVLLSTAQVARAGGIWCFSSGASDPPMLVYAKGFSKPGKGTCKPFAGVEQLTTPLTRTAIGSACLNSAGDRLVLTYVVTPTVYYVGSFIAVQQITAIVEYPYPLLTGARVTVQDGGGRINILSPTDAYASPKCADVGF